MNRQVTNIAASVHAKLLNLARESERPFNELLQFFALERFLYRLSQTRHKKNFVLKGGVMFLHWTGEMSRPTRDIDLLSESEINQIYLVSVIKDICSLEGIEDGIKFQADSVEVDRIISENANRGFRAKLFANLGKSQIWIRIDVSYGDVIHPEELTVTLRTLLDYPQPTLLGYSIESAIAEKLHAIVKLGEINSRMKDYFDLWTLLQLEMPNEKSLRVAIEKTFKRRSENIPTNIPPGLADNFIDKKQRDWQGFLNRNQLEAPDLETVVGLILAKLRDVIPMQNT